jgi:hypothetical protein
MGRCPIRGTPRQYSGTYSLVAGPRPLLLIKLTAHNNTTSLFYQCCCGFISLNTDPDPGFLVTTNLGPDLAFWWELFKTFYLFLSSVAYPWNFYYWSGSADPCLWLMDLDPDSNSDPDPAISSLIFKMPTKNYFKKVFLLVTFLRYNDIIFQRKSQKEFTKQ